MIRVSTFFFLWGLASAANALENEHWNVVLITVDDMNCDSVGVFGCPIENITPNIDQLAAAGIRFEHAHVTIAICQPTRAVWMTGRFPHRNGALGFDPIDEGVPTLVEQLKNHDYFTAILGKVTHVVPTRKHAWDIRIGIKKLGNGRNPKRYARFAKQAIDEATKAGKPFFIMANAHDPHRPFVGSPQEQRRKLRGDRFPKATRTFAPKEIPVPGFLPDLPDIRKELAEYYASVHRADQTVGAILNTIESAGVADNTIVFFMSDHGMPLPFAKTNCWRHSTKTPWIVRWPGNIKPGTVDKTTLVSGIDLAPTILDSVQVEALPDVDGNSIVPALRGQPLPGRSYVVTHINRTSGRNEYPMRAMQNRRFGYIFNAWADGKTVFKNESQNGRTMQAMKRAARSDADTADRVKHFLYRCPEELYDYQTDPDALHNLIDHPDHQTTLHLLRKELLQQMTKCDDPQRAAFVEMLKSRGSVLAEKD